MCLVLAGVIALLSLSMIAMSMRGPVVVLTDGNSSVYLKGNYKSKTVDKQAISQFLTEYLKARYEWTKLDVKIVSRQISPLTTSAFKGKILKQVKLLKNTDFKDKVVSQSVTNILVKIDEKKVFASFDRILKIQGIALPVPTQAVFQINSGPRTQWNPVGLYVNGIIEHEGK